MPDAAVVVLASAAGWVAAGSASWWRAHLAPIKAHARRVWAGLTVTPPSPGARVLLSTGLRGPAAPRPVGDSSVGGSSSAGRPARPGHVELVPRLIDWKERGWA